MFSLIPSLGLLVSGVTTIVHPLLELLYFPYNFLTPILGQVLGTAFGGSLQTVSSSLSSF